MPVVSHELPGAMGGWGGGWEGQSCLCWGRASAMPIPPVAPTSWSPDPRAEASWQH